MHSDHDHSPEENGFSINRPLRPYVQLVHPRALSRRRFLRGTSVLNATDSKTMRRFLPYG